jgi:hypothetical protein
MGLTLHHGRMKPSFSVAINIGFERLHPGILPEQNASVIRKRVNRGLSWLH